MPVKANQHIAVERSGIVSTNGIMRYVAGLDGIAMNVLRCGLILVLVWIGGLKFANYEADSIVPLISNSPLMNFFYSHSVPAYRQHMNKEGEFIAANREWQRVNRTYTVSHALGCAIVLLGVLIALHWRMPAVGMVGSALLILMACTTLSFLVTTPEAWVPAAGDTAHGFPYLSGTGRLVIKDSIMLGAAFVTMTDSAKAYLGKKLL